VQQLAAVVAPILLGGEAARTPLGSLGLTSVEAAPSWRQRQRRWLGRDLLWELEAEVPQ
jgi:diaminohydroxyphosphoribosylaminopyrimidine deaminase/5-amino-6-(5-phosphoribosylamino)uracil reductase